MNVVKMYMQLINEHVPISSNTPCGRGMKATCGKVLFCAVQLAVQTYPP